MSYGAKGGQTGRQTTGAFNAASKVCFATALAYRAPELRRRSGDNLYHGTVHTRSPRKGPWRGTARTEPAIFQSFGSVLWLGAEEDALIAIWRLKSASPVKWYVTSLNARPGLDHAEDGCLGRESVVGHEIHQHVRVGLRIQVRLVADQELAAHRAPGEADRLWWRTARTPTLAQIGLRFTIQVNLVPFVKLWTYRP